MRSDIVPGGTFPDYELPDHDERPAEAQRAAGRRPADPHARARPLLPEGAPAAPRARRALSEDRRGLHPDRHDLDRRAPHAPGVPRLGRRAVAVPLRPGAHRPEGPGHPGVHRPRERPDDPAHARAQARAGRSTASTTATGSGGARRSSTSGTTCGRSRREIRPDWDLEHARAARRLGRGRPLALPRLAHARSRRAAIGVVVDAGRGELAARTPDVDGDPGLRRQLASRPTARRCTPARTRARRRSSAQCSSGMPPPLENSRS